MGICAFSAPPGLSSTPRPVFGALDSSRWRCDVKYGWIAVAAMMAALLSAGQVAAQYGTTEPASEEEAEEPKSELEKLRALEGESPTPDEPGAPPVTGARPLSATSEAQAGRAGMGTDAAERERLRRSLGEVGQSVARTEGAEDALPLKFIFHGFFRTRYNWIGNAPMPKGSNPAPSPDAFPVKNASFGEMRLRIDPEVTYGPNPDLPIARLRFTIDGFDNVVWGDNARVFSSPLFAVDQSNTDFYATDLKESLKLERAWIEFLVPVGQVRVGRMESHWATGLLTHAGNGLAEWGEYRRGETFDRVLFATRPITLARGIKKGDTRQTPLVYAFLYDRISQDPVTDPTIQSPPAATQPELFKPFFTTDPDRSRFPYAYLTNLDRRISEIGNVLAWFDEDYGRGATDELFAGVWILYRWQRSTESRITIVDGAWRLKHTLENRRGLAFTTEGEYYTILGKSGALSFTGGCPPEPCNKGTGNIHNALGRFGFMREGKWAWQLEGGFSSGDADILSFAEANNPNGRRLRVRGFNENIQVGLLMYRVALRSLTFAQLSPLGAAVELGANGSVWNSKYFMPSGRVTIVPGLEFHTQFLIGWAHRLDPLVYQNSVNSCSFSRECFYGWELDGAFRARMGARDIIWIDLEAGVMQPGQAFTNAGFQDPFLWTTQVRAAMIF